MNNTIEDKELIVTKVLGKECRHGSIWVDGYRDSEIEDFDPSGIHFPDIISKLKVKIKLKLNWFIIISANRQHGTGEVPILDSYSIVECRKSDIIEYLIQILKDGELWLENS